MELLAIESDVGIGFARSLDTLALDRMLRFRSPESTGTKDLASLTTGFGGLRKAVRSVVRANDLERPSTFLT